MIAQEEHVNYNKMKTVLNIENIDSNNAPLFLGEDQSLQRYDAPKYPKFLELWRQQKEFFWMPDEVKLEKDRIDYQELSDKEKFVFNSNLRWQTMTDSMLSRSIHKMSDYVSNPALEICMSVWADMETVHSFSYTWILQNITKEPNKFFNSILEDKEIVRRANEIKQNYDKLLGDPKNIKEAIFDSILSTQITEGLAFYVSFACSFFFGFNGKMEGNSKIIKLISRDENLHVAITQNILKIFKERKEEGFQDIVKNNEQKIYDMYGQAVENEKSWAEYLFSQGDLLGLNERILGKYIEWLANGRLVSLGYKKIFDQPTNPIKGWLDAYTDSKQVQIAPQESEISSYKISARNPSIDESEFDGFEL